MIARPSLARAIPEGASRGSIEEPRARRLRPLRGLRIAGLAFETIDRDGPAVRAYCVDVDGFEHELALHAAPTHSPCRHVQVFSDLLVRGLRAPHPIVVAVDGCPLLALRVRAAFGARARLLD